MIDISIVYALPKNVTLINCQVKQGTTIFEAIRQSGIVSQCQLDINHLNFGIYGKMRDGNEQVCSGDRIEIYRPLLADPKEIRRRRALEQK